MEPREIQTRVAILKRIRPDHVEAQYLPGVVLTNAALVEVRDARRELMGTAPYTMISIIPEDVDYAVDAMSIDHLKSDRKDGTLLAVAIVAHANMMELMLKLYFSYFPKLDRIHVTSSETVARQWLDKQLEELGQTGS